MEYFSLTEPMHNSIVCIHPSKLRPLVLYFWQTHFRYRPTTTKKKHPKLKFKITEKKVEKVHSQGMYMDVVYGKHDQLDCMAVFPSCRHTAIHETKFLNFHHLADEERKHFTNRSGIFLCFNVYPTHPFSCRTFPISRNIFCL